MSRSIEVDEHLFVAIQISLPMQNDGKIVVTRERLYDFVKNYSDQRTATVLERLHRTNGPGLPKRNSDNVTDEAIDYELECLSAKPKEEQS